MYRARVTFCALGEVSLTHLCVTREQNYAQDCLLRWLYNIWHL